MIAGHNHEFIYRTLSSPESIEPCLASTLLDAAVNTIPLAILVAYLVAFLSYDPWPSGELSLLLGIGLLVVPIVALLVATVVTARLIQAAESADSGGTS